MRCPKCGFNSFDHNLVCPKCRKDLTAARRLLNLSVPAPGPVDFFRTAAETTVEPFLEDGPEVEIVPEPVDPAEPEVEIVPEPVDPAEPEQLQSEAVEAETDDIEPVDELEDIEPEDDDDIAPLEAPEEEFEDISPVAAEEEEIEDISPAGAPEEEELEDIAPAEAEEEAEFEDIAAAEAVEEAELEDISPVGEEEGLSRGSFAAHLAEAQAQAAARAPGDEEIEIELADDDMEEIYAEPVDGDFAADKTVAPAAKAAMAQIKNVLTATGDLTAAGGVEAEPEEDGLEPAAPAEEAAEVLPIDEADQLEAELELEADEAEAAGAAGLPEPPPAPAPPAADDDFDDESEFNDLSDLVADLDLNGLDKKI